MEEMPAPLTLVLATRNAGKIAELRALLSELPVRLRAAEEFPGAPEVDEDRPTLASNARKKAEALHRHTGLPALADDTGLEVDALDGAPGVRTARFAGGPEANDAANRAHLLGVLLDPEDRAARFRTVMALAGAGGTRCVEGICRGRIARSECGAAGFGYDPVFIPEDETRTFAEMSAGEKNAVSHRARALEKIRGLLRQELAPSGSQR